MVSETNYKVILDNLFDGVYYVDRNRVINYWNQGAERISGFSKDEVVGRPCHANILNHLDLKGNELCKDGCPLHETLQDGVIRESSLFLHHKSGHRLPVHIRISPIRNESGEIIGAVEVFSDNSSALNMLQQLEDVQQDNIIDPMLKIGNRRYGEWIFEKCLYELRVFQVPFCVAMLDIDDFKSVNDHYGHQVGDQILEMVTRSLESSLRSLDSIYRWGGDELIMVLPNVTEEELPEILERIQVIIEKSFLEHDGKKLAVTTSIGATMAKPEDSLESIIERADKLMYDGKHAGGNRFIIG